MAETRKLAAILVADIVGYSRQNDGFIKAIGTLAQVIYIITPDDKREQTLNDAKLKLKTYLELLDAVAGPGSPTVQPSR